MNFPINLGLGSGFSTPIYASTAEVGVTVIMFHAKDPGAKAPSTLRLSSKSTAAKRSLYPRG
jgi:hypothetical protein